MLCRDLWCNIDLVCQIERFVRLQAVRIHNSGSFDLEFDGSVESEIEIKAILVIGDGTNGRNDKFSITSNVNSHISEVGMFVQYTSILFTIGMSVMN